MIHLEKIYPQGLPITVILHSLLAPCFLGLVYLFISPLMWQIGHPIKRLNSLKYHGFIIVIAAIIAILATDYYIINKIYHVGIGKFEIALDFIRMIIVTMLAGHYIASNEAARDTGLQAQRKLEEIQAALVASQMNPHVLLNILASATSYVEKSPEIARAYLVATANYLRNMLHVSANRMTRLGCERTITEEYLNLEALKLGDKLKTQIIWDAKLDNVVIPPLFMQVLVENAIKHGVVPHEGGTVHVTVAQSGDYLRMEVANTGRNYDPTRKADTGIGLQNLRERLRLHYGSKGQFHIASDGEWTTATIEVPLESPC